MKKKKNKLKQIKNLSSFFKSKNEWYNWSFYLYDPFFILFISFFLKHGKKKKVFHLVYNVFFLLKRITRLSPIYVLKKSIYNSQVFLEILPVLQKKKNLKKVRVLFYKSKMYNVKKRIKKGIYLIIDHVKLIKTNELLFYEKIVICILNAFFKQGPVYEKVQELHNCIGNINKKKRFYRNKNKLLHNKFKKNKLRKMRNIKKRIISKNRHKKKYSIYDVCYKLGNTVI
jgi:ribosomal protein S7